MLPSTDAERLDNKEGSRDTARSPGKEKNRRNFMSVMVTCGDGKMWKEVG